MKYLKIWTNFLELMQTLEYDEIGRLFEMMLTYADSGKEPEDFDGNERFLWPVAKQQIDLAAEKNEILRQNGMKGGRPRTKQNQTKPNETKENQTKDEKKRKEIERNEKVFIDDDNARAIAEDQNRVLDAAENAGFDRTDAVRAKLLDLFAEHGMQKMLDGIDSCVNHAAPNLAYLKDVLTGPKKAKDFEQRDYSGEQEAAMNRMIAWHEKRGGCAPGAAGA